MTYAMISLRISPEAKAALEAESARRKQAGRKDYTQTDIVNELCLSLAQQPQPQSKGRRAK